MKQLAFALVFGSGLALACGSAGVSTASTIPNGTWGGKHVALEASDAGAALQFDCAHGSVPAPLSVGADGTILLAGVFVKEHGGPIRIGESADSQTAKYSGKIQGKTMTLSIELTRDQQTVGPYALELGNPGHVVRCR